MYINVPIRYGHTVWPIPHMVYQSVSAVTARTIVVWKNPIVIYTQDRETKPETNPLTNLSLTFPQSLVWQTINVVIIFRMCFGAFFRSNDISVAITISPNRLNSKIYFSALFVPQMAIQDAKFLLFLKF